MSLSDRVEILERTPELVGRFAVVKLLGRGTAGSVYLVKDASRGGQQVALKLLSDELAFDEHTITRFREEWAVCQKIQHPNLVRAYDFLEYQKCLGFTMEYVDGCDLGKLLRQDCFSYHEIDRIMYQLLDALSVLHQANIMHRDVKLENIILKPDGSVKLGDLGLLKRQGVKALTRPGVLLGTPQYMPPEYVKHAHFDCRSDIYACGVCLYEMLSGKRRLDDKRGAAAINYLVETNFDFPRIEFPRAGMKYVHILQRSLAVSASDRFYDVREMQTAFEGTELEDPERYSAVPQMSFHFGGGSSVAAKWYLHLLTAGILSIAFIFGLVLAWYLYGR